MLQLSCDFPTSLDSPSCELNTSKRLGPGRAPPAVQRVLVHMCWISSQAQHLVFSCSWSSLRSVFLPDLTDSSWWNPCFSDDTMQTIREQQQMIHPPAESNILLHFPTNNCLIPNNNYFHIFGTRRISKPSCFLSPPIILIGTYISWGPRWASKAAEQSFLSPLARTHNSNSIPPRSLWR